MVIGWFKALPIWCNVGTDLLLSNCGPAAADGFVSAPTRVMSRSDILRPPKSKQGQVNHRVFALQSAFTTSMANVNGIFMQFSDKKGLNFKIIIVTFGVWLFCECKLSYRCRQIGNEGKTMCNGNIIEILIDFVHSIGKHFPKEWTNTLQKGIHSNLPSLDTEGISAPHGNWIYPFQVTMWNFPTAFSKKATRLFLRIPPIQHSLPLKLQLTER